MSHHDQFGVPLTASDPVALRYYDDALAKLMILNNDPVAEADQATAIDPGLVMGHVLKGLLCVLGTEKSLLPDAQAALAAGNSVVKGATERERKHLRGLGCWVDGRLHDACAIEWHDAWRRSTTAPGSRAITTVCTHSASRKWPTMGVPKTPDGARSRAIPGMPGRFMLSPTR